MIALPSSYAGSDVTIDRKARVALLACTALIGWSAPGHAESAPGGTAAPTATGSDAADADPAEDGAVIVVTGTRSQRTVADSPAPIDVIGEKQLQATGRLNVRDILQQLVPSYNNASGWTGGTGEAVKSASLRGLNSDQTLVLVNGKRRAGHSIVFVTARGNLGASPVDLDSSRPARSPASRSCATARPRNMDRTRSPA